MHSAATELPNWRGDHGQVFGHKGTAINRVGRHEEYVGDCPSCGAESWADGDGSDLEEYFEDGMLANWFCPDCHEEEREFLKERAAERKAARKAAKEAKAARAAAAEAAETAAKAAAAAGTKAAKGTASK